jgi:hypothetical protein
LLEASCTKGTYIQYSSAIVKWRRFCDQNNCNPSSPTICDVLRFLAEIFDAGLGYSTIITARSALSLMLPDIEGCKVGEPPMVVRLLKGVSKLKPPLEKYSTTWDVSQVLDLLMSWLENENLSLRDLSYKLVALLALTTAQRAQTLSSISIDEIVWTDPVQIQLSSCLKTTAINRPNKPLIVASFPLCSKLCVISTLPSYIGRTQNLESLIIFLYLMQPLMPESVHRALADG